MIAEVIVDIAHSEVDKIFDYAVPPHLNLMEGQRVLVPFGRQQIEGYIIRFKENSTLDIAKIKDIISPFEDYAVLPPQSLKLMHFLVAKYHLKVIDAIRLFIPAEMRKNRVKELVKNYVEISQDFLNQNNLADIDFDDAENLYLLDPFIKKSAQAQRDIFLYLSINGVQPQAVINSEFSAAALRNLIARGIVNQTVLRQQRTPYKNIGAKRGLKHSLTKSQQNVIDGIINNDLKTSLLFGVTGSGKTEVYMRIIEHMLSNKKSSIMLVPEISLTPQVLRLFRERFASEVAILHSGLSKGERFDEWHRILTGEAHIVVGARSAIFAPLTDIGAIIIDEEHDSSYISENNPRYDTITVAEFRQKQADAVLVLGSATPSIQSFSKAQNGEYNLFRLPDRINKRPLPDIQIVDMVKEIRSGNSGIFSHTLLDALKQCIEDKGQAMLFINRRGFASYLLCRSCGYIAKCTDCDVSLVYHREDGLLKCHYCDNRYRAPDICPQCGAEHIRYGNAGTQRIEAELNNLVEGAKVLRMDRDTTSGKDAHSQILQSFSEGKANILVGTQMIVKGHDFANVTLVGIVDADLSLYCNGYLGNERTFQLITQVSGRAGRENREGKVILQSYQPKHYVYKFASAYDYEGFYQKENNIRETTKYPPYSKFVRILAMGENEQGVIDALKGIWEQLTEYARQNREQFFYYGKMKAPVKRIQNKFRYQILLRLKPDSDTATDMIYQIAQKHQDRHTTISVEINPSGLT